MKLNKTIKVQMINAAITDKYEKQYEEAVKNVTIAARKWLVENSLHESIVSKLSEDELKYCQATTSMSIRDNIYVEHLPFLKCRYKGQVSFSPVYGADYYYVEDKNCLELVKLRELVEDAKNELNDLSTVVHSYTKAVDLFDALPWIKKYYPKQIPTTGTMVAKDVIDSLNAKFGG